MENIYDVSLDSIRGKTSGGHVTSNYTGNTYVRHCVAVITATVVLVSFATTNRRHAMPVLRQPSRESITLCHV